MMKKRSEEHTSELQSLMRISYAVFCLKKKKKTTKKDYKSKLNRNCTIITVKNYNHNMKILQMIRIDDRASLDKLSTLLQISKNQNEICTRLIYRLVRVTQKHTN